MWITGCTISNPTVILQLEVVLQLVYISYILYENENENSIQKEIKSRLKLRNACDHSVQNLLSSSLLSQNLKIKIYRTIILPVVCMDVKLGR